MQVESIQISQLSSDPANVRRHSEAQIEKLMGALRRWGQTLPLLVDQNGVVRIGNARLEAVRRLGWETVNIVRMNLSPSEWTSLSIADNALHDQSEFDEQALKDVLLALADEDHELATAAGFSPGELAAILGTSEPEQTPPQPPEEFQEVGEDIPVQHQCPRCKFSWSGSSAPLGGGQ